MPHTLRDALELWQRQRDRQGRVRPRGHRPLRELRPVELAAFDAAVTDWELRRGFERL